ncbi:DUF1460 domain-containing protein [Pseudomonas sp. A34-9]|uniref:DUF1460 domain-containing protein n=1 Tax=Pseudomonas sp. A34-9 TaxID=3034675 RepID=UPI00240E67DB|nr:DUF1460 domain-containing protein [Pseudomonas sp. A34-9]
METYTSATQINTQQPAKTNLDYYTSKKLESLLNDHSNNMHLDTGQTIDFISAKFLGTPYQANMLIGAENTPEKLVIDFRGLDCFTYLDYIEALRKSTSQPEFVKHLIQTRYVDGNISFLSRKHLFTDWADSKSQSLADDITAQISTDAVSVEKNLNRKADDGAYLPGLPTVKRNITYIPSNLVNEKIVSRLRTGDSIGIYTQLSGLDVPHVGFFIMTDKGPVFRNASSQIANKKVVDAPFIEYIAKTPGIIIFRTK